MPNFADFIIKILQEQAPDLDLSGGTAAQDILVNAPEYVLRAIIQRMRELEDRRDVVDPTLLSEADLDRVGNMVFAPRNAGIKSTGIVRLYFSRPTGKICEAGATFETASGLRFINKKDVYITAAAMALNIENDTYYLDVPSVEAEEPGSEYSIAAKQIVRMIGASQDLIKATNPAPFSIGADKMDNEQYMAAIKYAISVRDLVTRDSIHTMLSQNFQQYPTYYVAGYKDPEMHRDQVYDLSVGSCVDIYPYVHSTLEYTANLVPASGIRYDGNPVIFIRKDASSSATNQDFTLSTITDLPISELVSVEYKTPSGVYIPLTQGGYASTVTRPTPPYFMRVPCDPEDPKFQNVAGSAIFWNPRSYFSYPYIPEIGIDPIPPKHCLMHSYAEESAIVLVRGSGFFTEADEFRITYNGPDPAIAASMQDYVDYSLRKTINADHIIKAMIPVRVDISADILGVIGDEMVSDIENLLINAESYLDITLSRLIMIMEQNGAETVDLPVSITYRCFLPNGEYYSGSATSFGIMDIEAARLKYEYIGTNLKFLPGEIDITVIRL